MHDTDRLKSEMIVAGKRLLDRGYIAGSDGNLSVRLDQNRVLVTPSGFPKGNLQPEQLVVVSTDGILLEGNQKPSSELGMHLAVYRARSDVNACIHSHPPFATAFAVAGEPLPDNILPEVALFVGPIALTDYAPPGTDAVGESLQPYISNHSAFILKNHGLLTIGNSIEESINRHETVEHLAHILFLARQLGHCNAIPDDDLKRLRLMAQSRTEQAALDR